MCWSLWPLKYATRQHVPIGIAVEQLDRMEQNYRTERWLSKTKDDLHDRQLDNPAESAMILLLDFSSNRRPDRVISLEWFHIGSSFFDFDCEFLKESLVESSSTITAVSEGGRRRDFELLGHFDGDLRVLLLPRHSQTLIGQPLLSFCRSLCP